MAKFTSNALGRRIPVEIGDAKYVPYGGTVHKPLATNVGARSGFEHRSKVRTLEEAVKGCGLRSGMTVSFHHHLRNGDKVLNLVLGTIARLGIRDLTVAASGLFPVHEPLVELMRQGVVTGIDTSYMNGPVADSVSRGLLARPAMFRTHGGRARAIESGQLKIDVAFIAAPCSDKYGNANGIMGKSRCGPLGYSAADAAMADHVVIVTDNLVQYPAHPISISQKCVDYVVVVNEIGDPGGIVFGTTRVTTNPIKLRMAKTAADILVASGVVREGFSFQTGAGGTSLAVAGYVYEEMKRGRITGSFGAGGITSFFVRMLREGIFQCLLDLQSLDLDAVDSLGSNPRHVEVDASFYANPWNKGCWVDNLDVMILGATEVDVDFNVNVLTTSDGMIMGGSGGHADTAAGADLAIVLLPLHSRAGPRVVPRVRTVVTPGATIDAVVTDEGVAVNPLREDILDSLRGTGLVLRDIHELAEMASRKAPGLAPPHEVSDDVGVPEDASNVVGLVEYRDGTIIDVVRCQS